MAGSPRSCSRSGRSPAAHGSMRTALGSGTAVNVRSPRDTVVDDGEPHDDDETDAREVPGGPPARRRLAVRAEMGRLPRDRHARRGWRPDRLARRSSARSLLPGARGAARGPAARHVRDGRRDRDDRERRDGLRDAAAPAASGRVAREQARRRDPVDARGVRPVGARRPRRSAARHGRAACRARGADRTTRRRARSRLPRRPPPWPGADPHAADGGRGDGGAVVRRRRRRRAGRHRRQARRATLRRGRARDGEGEAPPHRRLRGRRISRGAQRRWRGKPAPRVSTTTRARCSTSATRRRSRRRSAASSARRSSRSSAGRASARAAARADPADGAPAATPSGSRSSRSSSARFATSGSQGGRFRHSASIVRWRTDRDPKSCTFDQLEPGA